MFERTSEDVRAVTIRGHERIVDRFDREADTDVLTEHLVARRIRSQAAVVVDLGVIGDALRVPAGRRGQLARHDEALEVALIALLGDERDRSVLELR